MIAWLQGEILEKNPPFLVLVVNNVGYAVETSMQTFFQLPDEGQKVALYIQTIIREDAHLLYGFYEKAEREIFQLLIKVNGIGPKLALGILSGMAYQDLVHCIAIKNTAALGKIPGIGKKTAERLVIEMQDKVNHLSFNNTMNSVSSSTMSSNIKSSPVLPFPQNLPEVQDAMSALTALGYKLPQISLAIESIAKEANAIEEKNSEQLIREALKYFVRV